MKNYLLAFFLLTISVCSSSQTAPSCCPEPERQKQKLLWQKLDNDLHKEAVAINGVMGVAVLDLTSGDNILINGDEVMPQASSIKIAVLAELYRQAQSGKLKLTDVYVVRQEDLVPDSSIMNGLTPGVTRITLRDLATMMIAVSDNSATNVLIDKVGFDNVHATMRSLGLKGTLLRRKMMDLKAAGEGRENVSTPREMMTLLRSVYEGKLLNKEMTADFFKMLGTPKDSNMLKGLPEDVAAATKPGELEAVRNESGVIFLKGRPFVLCIMNTYLQDSSDGTQAISRITRTVFNYFDRVARASEYGRVISPRN